MTIGDAIQALLIHWGQIHIDASRDGTATVSDTSSAKRQWSGGQHGTPRVFEAESLAAALTVAIHAEGLGG
jgi:hypothetical protein